MKQMVLEVRIYILDLKVLPNLSLRVIGIHLSRKCQTLSLVWLEAGNVIGGGDWAKDRIIVDCVKAFFRRKDCRNQKSKGDSSLATCS